MNNSSGSSPSGGGPGAALAESPAGAPDLRTRPLHEDIAACARELWRKYGCPVGRDEQIWLEAERQLLGTDAAVARVGDGASPADALNQAAIPASTASPGGQGQVVRADVKTGKTAEKPRGAAADTKLAAAAGPVTNLPARR